MGAVIGTLAELGYGCAWRVLDAKEFGVPQRRRRVFIVAKRFGDAASCAKVLFERKGVRGDSAQGGTSFKEITREIRPSVKTPTSFIKVKNAQSDTDDERWEEGDIHPTLNSFHASSARATAAIVEEESIVFYANHGPDIRIQGNTVNTLAARMGTGGNNMPMVAEVQNSFQTKQTVRRLTPTECERLQGFPDQWTASQADSQRYKQMGNAVAVPVVQWIIDGIVANG
jgi:DNA (cytosine-5)-methyltransferase 1